MNILYKELNHRLQNILDLPRTTIPELFLGFNPPDKIRIPNTLVKKKIMKALGYEINESTSAFSEDFYNRIYD